MHARASVCVRACMCVCVRARARVCAQSTRCSCPNGMQKLNTLETILQDCISVYECLKHRPLLEGFDYHTTCSVSVLPSCVYCMSREQDPS